MRFMLFHSKDNHKVHKDHIISTQNRSLFYVILWVYNHVMAMEVPFSLSLPILTTPPSAHPSLAATNPCSGDVGCSFMCLISSQSPDGYNCVCPDGMALARNKKDCVRKYGRELMKQVETAIMSIIRNLGSKKKIKLQRG